MQELVTVEVFQYVAEADHMKAVMQSEGIETYLADDNLVGMDWLLTNAVGGIKLQVASKDVAAAKEVIDRWRDARKKPDGEDIVFECENCGKQIQFPAARSGGVETCKYCCKYVDVPARQ